MTVVDTGSTGVQNVQIAYKNPFGLSVKPSHSCLNSTRLISWDFVARAKRVMAILHARSRARAGEIDQVIPCPLDTLQHNALDT